MMVGPDSDVKNRNAIVKNVRSGGQEDVYRTGLKEQQGRFRQ